MTDREFMRNKKLAMIRFCFWFCIMIICGLLTFFSIQGNDFGLLGDVLMAPVPIGVMIWAMISIVMSHNMDKALAWPPPSWDMERDMPLKEKLQELKKMEKKLSEIQMYEIEFGKSMDEPLAGSTVVPESLLTISKQVVKDAKDDWHFYRVYKVSPENLKNDTKGELVEEWVRENI